MIFGIKRCLMPAIKGDEAQELITNAVRGGATSHGGTVWCYRN